MHKTLIIFALLSIALGTVCQTTLYSGDIAFIAINSDGSEDQFSFLLLKDISSGTSINFTDNGWTSENTFNTEYTEAHITWTTTTDLPAGTIETITTYNGNQLATAKYGLIGGEIMTLSVAGDQVLAYQGSKTEPEFIAAISFNQNMADPTITQFDGESNSNSTTALPQGLTLGRSAIHIYDVDNYSEQDNSRYNCSVITGSKEELLSAIGNNNNWETNNSSAYIQDPFPCIFNVSISTSIHNTITKNLDIKAMQGKISINFDADNAYLIHIFDSSGVIVYAEEKESGQAITEIEKSLLKKGLHIIQIKYNNESFVRKIIL